MLNAVVDIGKTHIKLLVLEDGQQQARIGAGRWISQTTAAGNSLLPFAPLPRIACLVCLAGQVHVQHIR